LKPSDDGIITTDPRGTIDSCNRAAEALLGYEAAQLIGQSVQMLVPADRQAEMDAAMARFAQGDGGGALDAIRVDRAGRRRDVVLTMAGLIDGGHRLVGMCGIVRDLTGFRQAASAQAYLASIVESSDDAIISKNLDGIIQSANAAAERMFGYTSAELVGRPVRILIPADRQDEEDHILARIRRGDRVDHFETVRMTKDGQLLNVSLTISPVRDASGTIIGVSKVARDITEQRRAASDLAAQQEWFRVTLGSIGDAVIACDPRARVTFMNATAEALTGWSAAAARGRRLSEIFRIIHEHSREPIPDPALLVMQSGGIVGVPAHTILVAADGSERPIDDSGAPIRNRHGEIIGVVFVFRDVSERRRVESERAASIRERDRLLEAERVARSEAERANRVKDDFVAMVSHELRTPLNAILGWTELMARNRQDPVMIQRGLDIVARNTRMQSQLISDLLDVSRIATGKLQLDIQRVSPASIIADAVETVQQTADAKGVAITREIEPGVEVIAGDPARLQQVVWNLLTNAIKFTPAGGRVSVCLRRLPAGVQIVVSDTGAGIKPEFLPRIFDRFQQADLSVTRRFGGLGLGLAIVRHLVELHGGSVEAASPGEGRGATFAILLPSNLAAIRDAEPLAAQGAARTSADVDLSGLRVLVLEDEADTREFLRRLLEAHGAEVSAVGSAAEAFAHVAERQPDLLISDIGLPEVDGYDLMRQIRRQERPSVRLPAIALTAYARTEDRTRALLAGYQAHVAKPVESDELLATVASFADLIRARRDSGVRP
jgi:PAS domain S-box-containing protein